MPRVNQITDSTTDKILRGVDDMCNLVSSGSSPTEAATKVAIDNQYTSGQIELLCRGYNNGAINAQRREGVSFADKFAVVGTADAEEVTKRIFPKKASSAHTFSPPVAGIYRQRKSQKAAAESAATRPSLAESIEELRKNGQAKRLPPEPTPYRKAKAKLSRLHTLRVERDKAEQIAILKTAAVEDAIRVKYREPANHLAWLRKVAFTHYGMPGQQIVDKAASKLLTKIAYQKLIDGKLDPDPRVQPEPLLLDRGPLAAVKEAVEAVRDWADKESTLPIEAINIRRDIDITYGPGKEKLAIQLPLPGKTPEESAALRWTKCAGVLTGAVGGFASNIGLGAPPDMTSEVGKARLKLNNPSHVNQLKAIRAEAMLNDLMRNDDVIASYKPEEVALAFMELSQSAPDAVDNIALLRANLRRNLQGNLTTYEAKELAKLRSVGPYSDREYRGPEKIQER